MKRGVLGPSDDGAAPARRANVRNVLLDATTQIGGAGSAQLGHRERQLGFDKLT